MKKPEVGILVRKSLRERIISHNDLTKLGEFYNIKMNPFDRDLSANEVCQFLEGMTGAISSWGTVQITNSILRCTSNLKILAHAAGSIKNIVSDEVWERGLIVTSAAPAIADDVAEMTIACMTIGLRNILPLSRQMSENVPVDRDNVRTLYRRTVGVIGASHVGRRVIDLLKPYDARILLYDPYLDKNDASRLGVELSDLDTISASSEIITCHAPMLPETYHLINGRHFKLMKDNTVIINTSRGDNIDESALIKELVKGRLFAFLDVTSPEPPSFNSLLRTLPNVILTPHIAGPKSYRTGALAVKELLRFVAGESQVHRVTKDMLPFIA